MEGTLDPASASLIRQLAPREFWEAVANFDPIAYWEKITASSLVLYGQDDTNMPSIKNAARLRSLNYPNIEVSIYEDSGHALEDPRGEGNSIFREDAMREIRDFIYSTSALP